MRSTRPHILLACVVLAIVAIPAASALTVTSISPWVAYADSTRTYDVYGTGFAVGAQVSITLTEGGNPIAATGEDWIDFTHIRCTIAVPSYYAHHDANFALYDLTVQNPRADSDTITHAFAVYPRPTVAGILPTGRPAPSVFAARLDGTGFRNGAEVYLQGGNGGTSTFYATGETVASETQIDCTFDLPASAYPGPYDVYVRTHPLLDYLLCMNDAFVVQLPASTSVVSVSPASALPGVNLTVDVTVYGLTNGAEVRVEGGDGGTTMIEATGETWVGPTMLRCTLSVPADAIPGPYTVSLRNPGGEWVSKSGAFTVTAPTPTVTGISPSSAFPGTTLATVYVTGTGFARGAWVAIEPSSGDWRPVIDATDETFINATAIRCSLAIPADASPGPYSVLVANIGTHVPASRGRAFTVLSPTPGVTGIAPDSAAPGDVLNAVLVSGTSFTTDARVTLYGGTGGTTTIEAANETFVSPAQIRCDLAIPADAYPGSYTVNVTNPQAYIMDPAHTGSRADAFTVTPPIPRVAGISPNSAPVGTTLGTVTVTGTGFANGAKVALNGGNSSTWIYATGETWVSPTQILCSLPVPADAYVGSYGVYVRNPGIVEWYGKPSGFTVTAPTPTITGISPNSALPGTVLTTVSVTGTGFARGAWVSVGPPEGLSGPVIDATDETFVNATAIRCSLAIPADAPPGLYSVQVANIGTHVPAMRGRGFTVLSPTPGVAAVSPDSAAPGDVLNAVLVSGTNFTTGARVTLYGGTGGTTTIEAVNETFVSPAQIRCDLVVPADAYPGSYTATVSNPPAYSMHSAPTGSRADAFTVTAPRPTVTNVSPASARPGDTVTPVTVTGTLFANGAEVAIAVGGRWIDATGETWVSPTQLRCTLAVPADAYVGPYGVFVRNPGAASWESVPDAFTVVAPMARTTGISPDRGYPNETLTGVRVSGTGFTNGATVHLAAQFGQSPVWGTDVVFVGPTEVRCTLAIPRGTPPGAYLVEVTNPGNTQIVSSAWFTVLAPPVVAVPPSGLVPTDTDADGLFDDVNGNGRMDFADVVQYFNQMTWITANEPVAFFDYNANGRIDFADVVWLFGRP